MQEESISFNDRIFDVYDDSVFKDFIVLECLTLVALFSVFYFEYVSVFVPVFIISLCIGGLIMRENGTSAIKDFMLRYMETISEEEMRFKKKFMDQMSIGSYLIFVAMWVCLFGFAIWFSVLFYG